MVKDKATRMIEAINVFSILECDFLRWNLLYMLAHVSGWWLDTSVATEVYLPCSVLDLFQKLNQMATQSCSTSNYFSWHCGPSLIKPDFSNVVFLWISFYVVLENHH